jgi:hypothetical protein
LPVYVLDRLYKKEFANNLNLSWTEIAIRMILSF